MQLLWALLFIVWWIIDYESVIIINVFPALRWDYSTTDVKMRCTITSSSQKTQKLPKKLQIYHLDALLLYVHFPPARRTFITMCSCLDKPPWGSFHASSDLKLLTSSHHANEDSGRAKHLYTTTRYHCWRTTYTSIMLNMGVFNSKRKTLLKVLFPWSPLIMFIKDAST